MGEDVGGARARRDEMRSGERGLEARVVVLGSGISWDGEAWDDTRWDIRSVALVPLKSVGGAPRKTVRSGRGERLGERDGLSDRTG